MEQEAVGAGVEERVIKYKPLLALAVPIVFQDLVSWMKQQSDWKTRQQDNAEVSWATESKLKEKEGI